MSGKVSYNCCFHDLENGLQTHCYAPMGLNIRGKWTLGGSLPGEPVAPVELGVGAPLQGLWLREDVDMTCNFIMTSFVKKTLKKAHSHLVGRLLVKAQILDASIKNQALNDKMLSETCSFNPSQPSTEYSPSDYDAQSVFGDSPAFAPYRTQSPPTQSQSSFQSTNQTPNQLYPAALSIRSSVASSGFNGSSMTGHNSYQESVAGSQHGNRVSWQNLNPIKSPQPEQTFQPYRGQNHLAAELHSQEAQKPTRPPPPQPSSARYAELE
jgi:hypothetical protein